MSDHAVEPRRVASPGGASILAWTLAWGLTGTALYVSGVLNSPRTGPLWVALVGGAVPWALAGYFTFRSAAQDSSSGRKPALLLIWALAYLLAFALAALAATALDMALGGFLFMLIGWTIGGGAGAFASALLLSDRSDFKWSVLLTGIWKLGFFVGSFLAFVGLYLGPELGKLSSAWLIGQPAALALGAGWGCALGGLAASVIAVPLTGLVARRV